MHNKVVFKILKAKYKFFLVYCRNFLKQNKEKYNMTYDELELDAVLLEVLENRGSFDSMDDEELYELIEQVAGYTDGDYEEAFEYMTQFSPIPKKRFVSLFTV